jgi:hypothetical protein
VARQYTSNQVRLESVRLCPELINEIMSGNEPTKRTIDGIQCELSRGSQETD